MDNFNEEEIQKKIEEKRKRFIENAHRALGFYDQNILSASDERKKKRAELIEKEFNKVFDEQGKPLRRYDEEPAKPLILAASKQPESVNSSPSEEKPTQRIKEMKIPKKDVREIFEDEDSLMAAEREMDSKIKPTINTSNTYSKTSETKATTPVLTSSKHIDKDLVLEETK